MLPVRLFLRRCLPVLLLISLLPAHAAEAPRVVSVGGGVTEIVYALGAESLLVGSDTSSVWPEEVKQLPRVGYQRTLSAEGVLSLRPTVLLASHEAGPPNVLAQLQGAGVRVVRVEGDYTFAGLQERIRVVSSAVGAVAKGQELNARLAGEWSAVQQRVTSSPLRNTQGKPLRVAFIMSHGSTTMAGGRDSGADAMLAMAGASNAFGQSFSDYKPFSAESLVAAAPDVIVTTRMTAATEEGRREFVATVPGVALTPAGKAGRIVAVDIVQFLGFGPRLPAAVDALHKALLP